MTSPENPSRRVVLVDGARIPFLRSNTDYRDLTSYDLARLALKGLLDKTQFDSQKVDQVIMGRVVGNVSTSNVARDALLGAGLPSNIPAHTVSMACISANQAITTGVNAIECQQANVVIAGGTDSLTDIPIGYRKKLRQKLIEAQKYRKATDFLRFFKGLSLKDIFMPEIPGIDEYSTGRSMGEDCDRMAARLEVSRKEQDEYAMRSHHKAAEAQEKGLFDEEVVPITVHGQDKLVAEDNGIRGDTSMEKLAKLKPAFVKPFGTITAGNASFLTDGASFVLLMAEDYAKSLGIEGKAYFHTFEYCAQDPWEELLLGPAYITPRVLDKAKLQLSDIDVLEFHEAFAGQIVATLKCLESDQFAQDKLGRSQKVGEVDMDKFNTLGGSLSLGHPFGATGARLVTTAANRLLREDGEFALVAGCAAGAMGSGIVLQRCK